MLILETNDYTLLTYTFIIKSYNIVDYVVQI